MNFPENDNSQSEDNKNKGNQSQDNSTQDERSQEMNDQEQSQTSEEPSDFSGVINASMEGTTEQQPLAQAYDAATPSFELESEKNRQEDEKGKEES